MTGIMPDSDRANNGLVLERGGRLVPLTNGGAALVDAQDYDAITQYTWNRDRYGYARRGQWDRNRKQNRTVQMHAAVAEAAGWPASRFDHINGDPLDNRRANLRPCTPAQNSWNTGLQRCDGRTSQYKGVSWRYRQKRFRAKIMREGVDHYLGSFTSEIEAARAYDAAARQLFSDFARLNFPDEVAS